VAYYSVVITSDDVLGAAESSALLGSDDRRAVLKYVRNGRLVPLKALPGKRGTLLFRRADVERLADELRDELTDELARLDAARQAS
jgi:hypothetical protein